MEVSLHQDDTVTDSRGQLTSRRHSHWQQNVDTRMSLLAATRTCWSAVVAPYTPGHKLQTPGHKLQTHLDTSPIHTWTKAPNTPEHKLKIRLETFKWKHTNLPAPDESDQLISDCESRMDKNLHRSMESTTSPEWPYLQLSNYHYASQKVAHSSSLRQLRVCAHVNYTKRVFFRRAKVSQESQS